MLCVSDVVFFFQAEDGIRDLVRSRGLGDVYKRQHLERSERTCSMCCCVIRIRCPWRMPLKFVYLSWICLLYTSEAADERSSVDLGGSRIIKKKKKTQIWWSA